MGAAPLVTPVKAASGTRITGSAVDRKPARGKAGWAIAANCSETLGHISESGGIDTGIDTGILSHLPVWSAINTANVDCHRDTVASPSTHRGPRTREC